MLIHTFFDAGFKLNHEYSVYLLKIWQAGNQKPEHWILQVNAKLPIIF